MEFMKLHFALAGLDPGTSVINKLNKALCIQANQL